MLVTIFVTKIHHRNSVTNIHKLSPTSLSPDNLHNILNNLTSDLIEIKTAENDMIIEQLITRRKNILKRACRFLNGIIGIWISGSMHDLLQFHELLMNSTNSDDDLEAFLSSFEPLQVENIMDSVKTNLVRWITSEKIGELTWCCLISRIHKPEPVDARHCRTRKFRNLRTASAPKNYEIWAPHQHQ